MSQPIWFNRSTRLSELESLSKGTMAAFLSMKWEEIGADFLRMSMPVNDTTRQPYGLLHGGASCALAETIGSIGSHLLINPEEYYCVGLDINANHIKSAKEGTVFAT